MPTQPPRACIVAGCPELITSPSGCPRHPRWRTYRRPGSTRSWRTRRVYVLRDAPLCVQCEREGTGPTPAVEVDHIRPVQLGGGDEHRNLQGLCHAHHAAKTARERGT